MPFKAVHVFWNTCSVYSIGIAILNFHFLLFHVFYFFFFFFQHLNFIFFQCVLKQIYIFVSFFVLWTFRTVFPDQIPMWRLFTVIFLLWMSNLIALWSENMITWCKSLLKLVLWLRTHLSFVNVVNVENDGCIVLSKSKRPHLLILLSKFSIALLIFCQLALLIYQEGCVEFSTMMIDISVFP